jgi:ribosomal protein L11 methyltransferase
MSEPQDVWIVSVPITPGLDLEALRDWLEETCDASPVEIEMAEQMMTWLEAYCDNPTTAQLLEKSMRTTFPESEPQVRHCQARDWTTFWRHHFKPVQVGKRLIIVPEWLREETDTEDREVILINPGLSFGTGDHFTTRYCLEAVDRLHAKGYQPTSMFDAGCGSAILSIAARKFGWSDIFAVDFDPVSINQAHENLELNGVTDGITLETMDLTRTWPNRTFPLVVANLYGGLLMELAARLVRGCSDILVLSGIRAVEAEAVSTVFAQLGAEEISSEADQEWCGMTFRCSKVNL